jgi:protein SCO1/2
MAAAALVCACAPRPREYPLRGVVVAVDPARQEITIQHDDIPRFMPGMTMPFKVRDPRLLHDRVPGDVVRGTLIVEDSQAHLRDIQRTGSAPVPAPPSPSLPAILDAGAVVPDIRFIDQEGGTRRLSDWPGLVLAVTFVYTRCPIPNFCPLMDRHFRTVQERVRNDEQLRGRVRLLSVSVDPTHDRPPVLSAHARRVGADGDFWHFVTSEPGALEPFASRFGVSIVRDNVPAQEIVHNLRTAVIAPDGRISTILRGNEWTPGDLVAELRKAVDPR